MITYDHKDQAECKQLESFFSLFSVITDAWIFLNWCEYFTWITVVKLGEGSGARRSCELLTAEEDLWLLLVGCWRPIGVRACSEGSGWLALLSFKLGGCWLCRISSYNNVFLLGHISTSLQNRFFDSCVIFSSRFFKVSFSILKKNAMFPVMSIRCITFVQTNEEIFFVMSLWWVQRMSC